MRKVKIYDVKNSALGNYRALKSSSGQYFYWNDDKFANNDPGDYVFIISRSGNEALFAEISKKGIPASYDAVKDLSYFVDDDIAYEVRGSWKSFTRFLIIEKRNLPEYWNWQTQMGSSEVYDLWKPELIGQTHRNEKLDDLAKIFSDAKTLEILQNCRKLLEGKLSDLNLEPAIVQALTDKRIRAVIESTEFVHQLATDKLQQLQDFNPSNGEDFYLQLLTLFNEANKSFVAFLNSFDNATDEYKLLRLIGELIAYCDKNAANKREFNKYPDHKTIALSFVRQTNWVENLLRYKAGGCDINKISSVAIRNAINYLLHPREDLPMLSENHRKMVARYLLHTAYDKSSFVADLIRFFEPYSIRPRNADNFTKIIGSVLYDYKDVKELWFEKIEGLVACDNTGWLNDAIEDLKNNAFIVLWWDKMPSGRDATLKLLREQIKENGSFYIFYTIDQKAHYRSRIVDFALGDEYQSRKWKNHGSVAWYYEHFGDYISGPEDNPTKRARIVFLADEIIKIASPFGYEHFEFYKNYQPPSRNNMQPYAELKAEVEEEVPEEIIDEEPEVRATAATYPVIEFDHVHRKVLMAVKTKPLVILAGISGTGKSRLARTLAYKTCALKELQADSPENFLLIQVKPNWHDSTELLGYVSRLNGDQYIITPFVQFLVKAWRYTEIPFILCLDEMNLAPVEHYFAEFLSAIESRDYKNGRISTDPLIPASVFVKYNDKIWRDLSLDDKRLEEHFKKSGLTIPPNLAVIGTVNMDETTHSFSRKVLDRAMTLEMNEVILTDNLESENADWDYPKLFYAADLVLGVHTSGGQVYRLFDEASSVLAFLEKVNKVLDKTPFKIAYRVRDEALVYCYHNSKLHNKEPEWLNTALDEIVCMKILPRIEGDESKTEKVIKGLLELLPETEFKDSYNKLNEMYERLSSFGYTSFWP